MCKLGTTNMAQTSDLVFIDNSNGYDSRLPIDMWYRRALADQGMGVSNALNIIWE